MDRARRTAATTRRKTLGGSASPQSTPPESLSDHPSSASPVMAHASAANSPQPATQSRRGSKSLHHAFTFSTPASGNRGQGIKRRSRTMDSYGIPDDDFDEDSPRKGGHTLRKRARVDYTFEHVDDEVVVPSSTSSARNKKRKSDNSYDSEEFYGSGAKRRGASLGADASSNVRRNPSRSSALGRADHGDDEDVKDTIEVGVSFSDMDESEVRRGSHSSASSAAQSLDGSWKSAPAASNFGSMYLNDKSTNENPPQKIETQDLDIDPNLRASPPPALKEPTTTVDPMVAQSESTDTKKADEPSKNSSNKAEESLEVSGIQEVAEASKATTPPVAAQDEPSVHEAKPVVEPEPIIEDKSNDETAPVPETVTSDEVKDNTPDVDIPIPSAPAAEANTNEPSITEPDAVVKSPSPPKPEVATEPMEISPAKRSPSVGIAEEVTPAAEVVQEPTEDATTKRSTSAEPTSIVPSISVEEVAEPKTQGPEEQEKEQETSQQESKESPASVSIVVEDKDSIIEGSNTTSPEKKDIIKPKKPSQLGPSKPQPAPIGRWAHLTPYMDGEYVSYPEKKARSDDEAGGDDSTPDDKDGDKDGNAMEPMVEDNDDAPEPTSLEAPTPALNTPTRGSPVPDSMDPTATNSPAPAGDDGDDGDMSDSQEVPERKRYYKYRKVRDPEEYISAIENYEDMTTTELYEILEAINISLVQWQTEWTELGKVVDDHENALRRRQADAKYESRTRNLAQHGVNHEEPDFVVKGYKSKERELMSETRYLQGQDRIMAATYGFEYDPHPSKIGRQNPETQQVGIMTRGRSLRNQPRQTVKASEADEVTGKRQRKPVQLFDPAPQDVSRSSTPVPTRGRRRRNANPEEEAQVTMTSSFNGDGNSDEESAAPKTRRRRGPRASNVVPSITEELATPRSSDNLAQEETGRSGRRRGRQPVRYDETYAEFIDDDSQPEPKQRKRHMLTLKIPRSKNFSEPSSAITDNGDSRPSTASSESSSHTAESSYSFRPKRQKRFRDDPDETDEAVQAPPRKRGKRSVPQPIGGVESSFALDQPTPPDAQQGVGARKIAKIKVVRPPGDTRNGTPSSQPGGGDGDDKPKDYKNMTKSEKMSASMKSRWANGNMAGAVEKRKATLAAKKAAQAAAEQKLGVIAPKPKVKPSKKELPPPGQPPTGYVPAMPGINYPFPSNQ
ncbi:hypothetical protein VFPPC_08858 [Pochonia chlamydosporia 170]|uniref:Uncharacterized protein n=1 Tax=Pochonia chlamydosporia 170 TaxID=1380566 RepID=A0A179FCW0_METCM|nr:hypothetical protein VFPPC_08858 [Pochonia chlamydosporia 170]OAQ62939.2 hypothetical protein VFPPC_08858 [Pochonia chlamydosporia 170]